MLKDLDGNPIRVVFDFGVFEIVEELTGVNLFAGGDGSVKTMKAVIYACLTRGGSNIDQEWVSKLKPGEIGEINDLIDNEEKKFFDDIKAEGKNLKRRK